MKYTPILFAMMSLLAACQQSNGPRQPHFPTFDARQPFPELMAQDAKRANKRTTSSNSSFERAISKELRTGGEEGSSISATAQNVQTVSLASVFVADVPVRFNDWRVASDGSGTIITHQTAGALPDALVYIEGFSPAVETFPSYEVARFQMVVDPGLSPNALYPPLIGLGASWVSNKAGVPPLETVRALQQATTRTMGLGLGYRSIEDTFTGWKWIGKNDADLKLRLGRTTGSWGPQDNTAIPRAVLELLKKQVPNFDSSLGQLFNQRRGGARRPAWMIFGSVAQKDTLGIHIAVICQRQPVCPVAEELSQIINTIRPREASQTLAAPTSTDLKGFANELGVSLLDKTDVISAPQMVRILEQAMRAKKRAAGQPGAPQPGQPKIPKISDIPGLPTLPEMPTIPNP